MNENTESIIGYCCFVAAVCYLIGLFLGAVVLRDSVKIEKLQECQNMCSNSNGVQSISHNECICKNGAVFELVDK